MVHSEIARFIKAGGRLKQQKAAARTKQVAAKSKKRALASQTKIRQLGAVKRKTVAISGGRATAKAIKRRPNKRSRDNAAALRSNRIQAAKRARTTRNLNKPR